MAEHLIMKKKVGLAANVDVPKHTVKNVATQTQIVDLPVVSTGQTMWPTTWRQFMRMVRTLAAKSVWIFNWFIGNWK